jgi:hypothetical protein
MYYTGIDPFTKQQVYVAKGLRDRKMQRTLMQFVKPENWFTVREALLQAGRQDPIDGCEGLIPANQPKEALEKRRGEANWAVQGDDHYHTIANPAKGDKPGEGGAGPSKPTGCGRGGSRRNGVLGADYRQSTFATETIPFS